jgi:uncharacterized protein (DUF885 family)
MTMQSADNSAKQLNRIISDYQDFYQQMSPFNQPIVGETNAYLPDLSAAKMVKTHQRISELYQQLMLVSQSELSLQEAINWSVLSYKLKNQIDSYINKEHYMPLTAESGFHVGISWMHRRVNFSEQQDYLDYLSRLKALPKYFDQQMWWMQQGIDEGITQPAEVLLGFEDSIQAIIQEEIIKSEYYKPFINIPKHISAEQQKQLRVEAQRLIKEVVYPSYQKYYDFIVNQYVPNARKDIAASSLPNGDAYYQNRVEHYTTLKLSAQEIHRQGLTEVKRIRADMDKIIAKLGFQGDFASFIEFLRTDTQFYATSATQLLKEASFIAKKMDAQLPKFFKTLPRTPYGVMAVPASIAPKYTTGRYSGPSREGQAGYYWVNTYRLDKRPLYVLEALTLHEAVPGHHLQGSIAREMTDVPEFRANTYISAFGEGWGLYAEFLGIEAGFYQDPYSDFGRLTYEMWRACRLVVDTGMHSKNWSRDKAAQYLANNTALSLHNVYSEIDRYISWPGQALSYKIGELTIKRLRAKAEKKLAQDFDLREFHDKVLSNGSIPLTMLEQVIDDYISKKEIYLKGKLAKK